MFKVNVLIFRGVKSLYTYSVTEAGSIKVGDIVEVPFGNSHCKGLVYEFVDSDNQIPSKEIIKKTDDDALLESQLILLKWFKDYYGTTPYQAYQIVASKRKKRELIHEEPSEIEEPTYELTNEQINAIESIKKGRAEEFLLHGVTGSGKTEVYIQLAKYYIKKRKQVIILVPEIALTPQFINVFTKRFKQNVALLHSGLTSKQKDIEWQKVYTQSASIVIGARSAIFAPFENLGLIIIDECHDQAYKQENNPRYSVYQVAKKRQAIHHANLVMGSATPPIELYYQLEKNNRCLKLTKRANQQSMPKISIKDLSETTSGQQSITRDMLKKIEETLNKKQKVILLLNRRGYAPYISCENCKKVHQCEGCGLSFTYHSDKKFRCHRCFITKNATHACTHCGQSKLTFSGQGTQGMIASLKQYFPDAHLVQFDKDAAKSAKSIEKKLNEFKKKGDILVGTQMIAKGHHIESVTFVGVIGIDTALNMPDFRCSERSFQLLTQVSGRAGRGQLKGEVMIESSQPNHYAIRSTENHNYESFYQQELAFREFLNYPPFTRIITLLISEKKEKDIGRFLQELNLFFRKNLKNFEDKVQIIGPKLAPIEKVKHYKRWQYIFKIHPSIFDEVKKIIENKPANKKSIRVFLDIDAQQLL